MFTTNVAYQENNSGEAYALASMLWGMAGTQNKVKFSE